MVKKICSTILSVLLLCTVCLPAFTVSAADVVVDVPNVEVTVYEINVSITVARRDALTLKVYQLAEDPITGDMNPTGDPIYVGVSAPAPTPVEVAGDTVIQTYYTHTFPTFNLDRATPTGDYRAVVANTYETDFPFINKIDKINFYNQLTATADTAMEAKLQAGKELGYLPYVSATYLGLAPSIKGKVNTGLADYPFPALTLDPLATDGELIAFEDELRAEYDRLMQAAGLAIAADGPAFDAAVDAATALSLDRTKYDDAVLALTPASVRDRFVTVIPETFANLDVQKAFDLACLLAIIDTADYGSVTTALDYYDAKANNVITLDTTYSATFAEASKNTLSNNLKLVANEIATKTDLETKYYNLSYQIAYALSQGAGTEDDDEGGSTLTGGSLGGGTTRPTKPEKPETTKAAFSDVASGHWAEPAVTYLAGKGVVSGKGDGKFYPEDGVTREEFTKMIVEAFRLHNQDAKADFADVAAERWSNSYIASALEAQLINGVSATEFAPGARITRQDMAVIIYRTAELLGVNLSGNASFADNGAIASYAKEAVAKLAGAGIVNGVENNRFAPKDLVTRAQAAKIIYELAMKNGGIM